MSIIFRIKRKENKKAYGTVVWSEKGLSSGAVSGPYGRGELPEGLYHTRRSGLLDKPGNNAFCDSVNKCWFQLLEPQFSTNRTELGIHPDGNQIGTKGCIGLIDADTRPWFEAFRAVGPSENVMVEVFDDVK